MGSPRLGLRLRKRKLSSALSQGGWDD
jgi:hypothetical protein